MLLEKHLEDFTNNPQFILNFDFSKELDLHLATHVMRLSGALPVLLYKFPESPLSNELKGVNSDSSNKSGISSDSRFLASLVNPSKVIIYDLKNKFVEKIGEFNHNEPVDALCFNAHSDLLITSSDLTIFVWEVKTGICRCMLKGHRGRIKQLCFSPDQMVLASSSEDRGISLWDVNNSHCITTIYHRVVANQLAFTPDGASLIAFYNDGSIIVWHIKDDAWRFYLTRELTLNQALLTICLYKAYMQNNRALLDNRKHLVDLFKTLNDRFKNLFLDTMFLSPPANI
jgi:WD40 repeat protein